MSRAAAAAHSLSSYGGVGHLYSDVFLLRSRGLGVTASFPSPKSMAFPLAEGDGVGRHVARHDGDGDGPGHRAGGDAPPRQHLAA